jgi:hypothetical protein
MMLDNNNVLHKLNINHSQSLINNNANHDRLQHNIKDYKREHKNLTVAMMIVHRLREPFMMIQVTTLA